MKKLIVLVLILIITPFFIVSEDALVSEIEKIKLENIKNPKTVNWEYLKDRAFDKNGVLQKGYDKPVLIILDKSATYKDSIFVNNFIKELTTLIPSVLIGLKFSKEVKPTYHQVNFTFRKDSTEFDRYMIKTDLLDGSTVEMTDPKKLTISSSDGSKFSHLNFKFKKNITDQYRKMYIEYGLLTTIFSTEYMNNFFNNAFPVMMFNELPEDNYLSIFGGMDKFFIQKLYAPDFLEQFQEYLDSQYPWRYANSFLNKKWAERKAMIIVLGLGLLVLVLMMSTFQNKKFKYTFLNYFLPVLFLLFHLGNLSLIYKYLIDFNSFIGWDQNIVFMLTVIPPVALLASLLLWSFDKYIVKENMNFTLQLISKVSFTFIIFNIPLGLILLLNEDTNIYNSEFQDFYFPMLFIWLGLSIGRGLLIYLNHISDSLVKQKDVELSQLKEANAQAEVRLLQSQINPHFLYNSLNSIAGLAHEDATKTEKMALSLSNLFRYSINRKKEKKATIKDEIAMVQNYLEIEQIRFGDRLQFLIEVQEGLENEQIPRFVLQPLVENAVKHGVSKIEGKGNIVLKLEKTEKQIVITVSDNGPDFPEDVVSGYGLQSVLDLLRLTYGNKASMNWVNEPKKKIMITINQK